MHCQLVETTPWKDIPRKLIFYWHSLLGPSLRDPPLKALRIEDPVWLPLWSSATSSSPPSPRCVSLASLSPKLQEPFFHLCDLFPGPISSPAHFYLGDFLNKLSFIVWVLTLNTFTVRTQVPKLRSNRCSHCGGVLPPKHSQVKFSSQPLGSWLE